MEANLITLITYKEPQKAYFLKNELEKQDIVCFLSDEDLSNISPGIKVRVKPEHVENAVQVILDIRESYGSDFQGDYEDITATKKILLPVDFSEFSLTAARFAFGLASKINAEIKLLHVYEESFMNDVHIKYTASYQNYLAEVTTEARKMAERNMLAFNSALNETIPAALRQSVLYHASFVSGRAAEKIIQIAEKYLPECIILGTRGKASRPNDLIGRVTLEVIEEAFAPVLAIPEGYKFSGFDDLRVMYATDFYDDDRTSLNKLMKITKALNPKIYCVHIDMENDLITNKRQMDLLNVYLKEQNFTNIDCYLMEGDDLFLGIDEFVSKNRINLLSFTSPERSVFDKLLKPNNLKKLLFQSTVPMLVFKY